MQELLLVILTSLYWKSSCYTKLFWNEKPLVTEAQITLYLTVALGLNFTNSVHIKNLILEQSNLNNVLLSILNPQWLSGPSTPTCLDLGKIGMPGPVINNSYFGLQSSILCYHTTSWRGFEMVWACGLFSSHF